MEIIINKKNKDLALPISIGSTVEGIVVARERSALYIDLGVLGTGIIYGREYFEVKETIKSLVVGDKIFAKIVEMENDEGYNSRKPRLLSAQ